MTGQQSFKLLLSVVLGKQRRKVLEVFVLMEVCIMVFPDNGDSMLLLEVDIHLPDYTVSQRRRCKTKGSCPGSGISIPPQRVQMYCFEQY
jgi:hypothetical protein